MTLGIGFFILAFIVGLIDGFNVWFLKSTSKSTFSLALSLLLVSFLLLALGI